MKLLAFILSERMKLVAIKIAFFVFALVVGIFLGRRNIHF